MAPLEKAGAMTLYTAGPTEHLALAKHLTAEVKTEVRRRPRRRRQMGAHPPAEPLARRALSIRADAGTAGRFEIAAFLVGDVNGDQTVNRADAAQFAASFAATAAQAAYRTDADANLDGVASLTDLALLQNNFGASTSIRPLTLTASVSPAPGVLPGGGENSPRRSAASVSRPSRTLSSAGTWRPLRRCGWTPRFPRWPRRNLAIVHAAIFDAVTAVEGNPGYYVSLAAPAGVSAEAAVAGAAHRVLSYLYPAQQAYFDSVLAASLAQVADGSAESAGVAFGQTVGQAILDLRSHDGWDDFVDYTPGSGPGAWQPPPPMYAVALAPQWADVGPLCVKRWQPAITPNVVRARSRASRQHVDFARRWYLPWLHWSVGPWIEGRQADYEECNALKCRHPWAPRPQPVKRRRHAGRPEDHRLRSRRMAGGCVPTQRRSSHRAPRLGTRPHRPPPRRWRKPRHLETRPSLPQTLVAASIVCRSSAAVPRFP
jgi:hypothetical protein